MQPDKSDFAAPSAQPDYELSGQDQMAISAAKMMLVRLTHSWQLRPSQLVSVAKLIHALELLPRVAAPMHVRVVVAGPPEPSSDGLARPWWEVGLEHGRLCLCCGAESYPPTAFADRRTAMMCLAQPGRPAERPDIKGTGTDYPGLGVFEHSSGALDFSKAELDLLVIDPDNPWLKEAGEPV